MSVRVPGTDSSDRCDLHVHTTASDGTITVREVINLAEAMRLRAIGITDHDTTSGVDTLRNGPGSAAPHTGNDDAGGSRAGVEIVPGVEINTEWRNGEIHLEVHVLGYYIPAEESPLHKLLERLRSEREKRIIAIIERLGALGLKLDPGRVFELSTGDSIGRPHVAQAMVEQGYVGSVREAFERYLGVGRPAYVERFHLLPGEAVRAIVNSGGVAVWAHPGKSWAEDLAAELLSSGLDGIEAYHPDHEPESEKKFVELARHYNLIVTGGSDFHGPGSGEGGDLGSVTVSYRQVQRLQELAEKRRRKS